MLVGLLLLTLRQTLPIQERPIHPTPRVFTLDEVERALQTPKGPAPDDPLATPPVPKPSLFSNALSALSPTIGTAALETLAQNPQLLDWLKNPQMNSTLQQLMQKLGPALSDPAMMRNQQLPDQLRDLAERLAQQPQLRENLERLLRNNSPLDELMKSLQQQMNQFEPGITERLQNERWKDVSDLIEQWSRNDRLGESLQDPQVKESLRGMLNRWTNLTGRRLPTDDASLPDSLRRWAEQLRKQPWLGDSLNKESGQNPRWKQLLDGLRQRVEAAESPKTLPAPTPGTKSTPTSSKASSTPKLPPSAKPPAVGTPPTWVTPTWLQSVSRSATQWKLPGWMVSPPSTSDRASTPWRVPTLPSVRLPRLGQPTAKSRSWSLTPPSSDWSLPGSTGVWLTVTAALAVVAFVLIHRRGLPVLQRWIGPPSTDAAAGEELSIRQQIQAAIERQALRAKGEIVRPWNHRRFCQALSADAPADLSASLQQAYEFARYRPPAETLSPVDWERVQANLQELQSAPTAARPAAAQPTPSA